MSTVSAYPLQWPAGWKRTPVPARIDGNFGKRRVVSGANYPRLIELTIAEAVQRVRDELRRMGVADDDLVINSNLRTRLDGFPISAQSQPDDSGVAVYWREGGDARRVMAIDRYQKVQDNLAAIAGTVEAMRSIERYGGAVILERAFTGFLALPAPAGNDWWDVLGVARGASRAQIDAAYRRRRSETHPDRHNGESTEFIKVQWAFEQATKGLA